MFNLFNKGPKIRAGKQNNQEEKKKTAAVGLTGGKTPRPADVLGEAWKKLQKMDRKQAYTWGGIAVVALVALISIASMGGQDAEDFTDFETRGYDLANMPFSTDEAEQYLLASKYPDMNDKAHSGLYSEAEKEARQAEDAAEAQAQLDKSASSSGSEYRPNRYYGGGGSRGGGAASPTQVGSLNSAGLKSASGSGMKSTFGPQGDFSNFRSQEKGKDKFVPSGPGKGNARTALIQTAQASRAAAGLKNDKLLNAKKAMMGGNVKGSDAFLDDSGAVNLGAAKGLELDTNAPISSADLSGLGDALQDANQDAAAEDQQEEEMEWWEEMLIDVAKQIAQGLVNWGMSAAQDATRLAQENKANDQAAFVETRRDWCKDQPALCTQGQFLNGTQNGNKTEFTVDNFVENYNNHPLTETQLGQFGYAKEGNKIFKTGQIVTDPDAQAVFTIGEDGKMSLNQLNTSPPDKVSIKNNRLAKMNDNIQRDNLMSNPDFRSEYDVNRWNRRSGSTSSYYGSQGSGGNEAQIKVGGAHLYGQMQRDGRVKVGGLFYKNTGTADNPNWILDD